MPEQQQNPAPDTGGSPIVFYLFLGIMVAAVIVGFIYFVLG